MERRLDRAQLLRAVHGMSTELEWIEVAQFTRDRDQVWDLQITLPTAQPSSDAVRWLAAITA